MAKYRKKPIVVEAFRLGYDEMPRWAERKLNDGIMFFMGAVGIFDPIKINLMIQTPEGRMRCEEGDYIIKGVAGEIYPCKAEIFEKTYETAKEITDAHAGMGAMPGMDGKTT
ncbi:MAG: hypothetical protein ACOX8Q_01800 [Christensenellales bacterium]|jgi:hypothetical protein